MTRESKPNDPRQIIQKLRQADGTLSANSWPDAFLGDDEIARNSKREQERRTTTRSDPLRSFEQFWSGYFGLGSVAKSDDVGGSTFDAKAWQRSWLDSAGKNMDAYLRSPMFVQMMKQHIDTLIRTRRGLAHFAESSEQSVPVPIPSTSAESDSAKSQAARFREAAATPYGVVVEEDAFRLLRYQNEQPIRFAEPILICFALVNRPYVLDLQVNRSVVRRLLARGFDLYLIDWATPTEDSQSLRLQDYICVFIKRAVDWICEQSGSPAVNLLGYCMGGTMSAMFTALNQRQVRNLVLMAAPIDFGGEEGLLNVWTKEEYFDVDGLIDAYGVCPGWFLHSCFQLMKPIQNFAEKYITLGEKMHDEAFLENFLAMERWANDNVPVSGETFREYVKKLYRENRFVSGTMQLDNRPVRLENIECPLLLLTADRDHLVPANSTLAIQKLVNSSETETLSIGAGHIGLAVSSKAHQELWPAAANWIAEHSTSRNASPATSK